MNKEAKFIWLDKERYPNLQGSTIGFFYPEKKKYRFGVVAFSKRFEFDKKIKCVEVEIFADTRYFLWVNGKFEGAGPCPTGGDFDMPQQYSSVFECCTSENYIDFFVRVQLTPTVELDNSKGKGGLVLQGHVWFEDGSDTYVYTDETWLARRENEFLSPRNMDYTRKRDEWNNATLTESVWNVSCAPIKTLLYTSVGNETFIISPKSKKTFNVELDKIYSAYSDLSIKANGEYTIELVTFEKQNVSEKRHIIRGNKDEHYFSNEYYGVGGYRIEVENNSDEDMRIDSEVIYVRYPSENRGYFKCSDNMLNRIYELGKWTVEICRQSIELDSPVHQENLFCTGDYLIESLVNNYTTGDYSLTRFDILRMGKYFAVTEGYMYNSNYTMLWFEWLYEYYVYSGDASIFKEVLDGMECALARFKTMENDSELLDDVTGYLFVDWSYVDGHSMFAPPRALGETVANAYYYNMINKAAKIYDVLNIKGKAEFYHNKSQRIRMAFNKAFYDESKGLYFDGLNIPTAINDWIPENPKERYYTCYPNTLAVLFELCDEGKQANIMEWVLKEENIECVQPYFMHFVLEAVYRTGLFEKYGVKMLKKWQVLADDCEKGMHEVWNEFEGYTTDYSHGWGATPTYQLPSKLFGIEIVKPGFEQIKICPNLCGLDWVEAKIPTPKGVIELCIRKDEDIKAVIPDGIEAVFVL